MAKGSQDVIYQENIEADTDGSWAFWPGGAGMIAVSGSTLGGGTVSLRWSFHSDGSNPQDVSGASLTAFGETDLFKIPRGRYVQLRLTGSTNPNCDVAVSTPSGITDHMRART